MIQKYGYKMRWIGYNPSQYMWIKINIRVPKVTPYQSQHMWIEVNIRVSKQS
jgi:hypothetical protein